MKKYIILFLTITLLSVPFISRAEISKDNQILIEKLQKQVEILIQKLNQLIAEKKSYDDFSTCLVNKKAIFYGAFWCPHCQNQIKLLKNSAFIPYRECSLPDGEGQTNECKEKEIRAYPTWIFGDNTTLTGEISLKTLSEKTGCELPTENK